MNILNKLETIARDPKQRGGTVTSAEAKEIIKLLNDVKHARHVIYEYETAEIKATNEYLDRAHGR